MKEGLLPGMTGRYFEQKSSDQLRFFEIHVLEYDIDIINRLNSIEDSPLGEYMALIDKPIPDTVKYLYKFQTYLGHEGIDDLWEFNEQISDYQEFGFFDIKELIEFCSANWGLKKEDFTLIQKTNIPY